MRVSLTNIACSQLRGSHARLIFVTKFIHLDPLDAEILAVDKLCRKENNGTGLSFDEQRARLQAEIGLTVVML